MVRPNLKQLTKALTDTLLSFTKEMFIVLVLFSLTFSVLTILCAIESTQGLDKVTIFALFKGALLYTLILSTFLLMVRTALHLGGSKNA